MSWQLPFVVAWIEFAAASALLLGGVLFIVRRMQQPAERVRLSQFALLAALAVPVVAALALWPAWSLGSLTRGFSQETTPPPVVPATILLPAPLEMPRKLVFHEPIVEEAATPEPVVALSTTPSPATAPAGAGIAARFRLPIENWVAYLILAAQAAAALYFAVQAVVGRRQLRQLCAASSLAPPQVQQLWQDVSDGRGQSVRLLVSQHIDAPLVFGSLGTTVVVPSRIVDGVCSSLRFCLAHEWSHIDRGDLRAWTLVRACRYLFWYQPAFWGLARELRISQEFLADHRSARSGDDPVEYSELLLTLAKRRLAAPITGALNMLDQPSQLGRRVRMLLEDRAPLAAHCRGWVAGSSLAATVLVVLGLSTIRIGASLADDPKSTGAKAHPSIEATQAAEKKSPTGDAQPTALHYTASVVEKETNKPIAGAQVTVRRSDYSPRQDNVIEESKHVTDADGKYSFTIPPEQVAVKRLYIELDVEHPDYAAKKGFGYALSMILKNETVGDRPFFEKTSLHPSDPLTGTVLTPDGQPLAGVKIQGFSRGKPRDFSDHSFVDTMTGADGRFRLPLVKGGDAVFWVIPKDFAIVQRYLGKTRGDTGEIRLVTGVRSGGQLLDAQGKPVPNVPVNIHLSRGENDSEFAQLSVFTSVRRSSLTDENGKFAFDPLPVGDYQVVAEERLSDPILVDRRQFELPAVFVSQKVTLNSNEDTPIVFQAVPHVNFEAQYYNSQGEKTNGHEVSLYGQMEGQFWHGSGRPDNGKIVLQVPHGLQEAQLQLMTNEHSSLRYRMKKDDPLKGERNSIALGTLNDDIEGVEIVRYVAPIVLVKAIDEEGKPLATYRVGAAYAWGQQRYILEGEVRSDLSFERQPDGRYRSEQMLPDEEVTFTVTADGYENASEKLTLPEGEQKELTLTLKKKAAAPAAAETPAAGETAPNKE